MRRRLRISRKFTRVTLRHGIGADVIESSPHTRCMTRKWNSWLSPAGSASPPKPTTYYNTHEAKNSLSELLRRVRKGEVIVIAHAGSPVAKLVPFKNDVELVPGVVRLSVYVDGASGGDATPTRSSPGASTSRREPPG